MRFLATALALAVATTMAAEVDAEEKTKKRSRYEADALNKALEERKLEVEPEPAGKKVGRIIVDNQPVFSKREGFLTVFNFFHFTTKESVIRREVLLRPGQVWDEELIEESRRKITDPLYTTLVVIAPIKNGSPETVDLLVVTRDIWSLRLNTLYEFQRSKLTELSFSLSENNVFGFRKTAAMQFAMDQGDIFIGPIYIDKNVVGSRMRFTASAGGLFARENGEFEGTRSNVTLAYPLWSSRSKWAADIGFSHFDGVIRSFSGTELELYDLEATPDVEEAIPVIYDLRTYNLEGGVTRSFGYPFIQRLRVGYDLGVVRPKIRDDFAFDDMTRDAFIDERFPRSERSSAIFFRYSAFLNKFKVLRNVNTYVLPEDIRVGPSFSAVVSNSLEVIGSERNFVRASATVAHTEVVGDTFMRAAGSVSTRLQKIEGSTQSVDRGVGINVSAASPFFFNQFRIVGEFDVDAIFKDRSNSLLRIGGDNGLRGYAIRRFFGDRRVRLNLEVRSKPFRLWFGRLGGLLFYDGGHAAQTFDQIKLRHNVGFGVRSLVPQLQRTVFRFDLALPLNDGDGLRFTSGIRQAF